jgi:drug/metabolite transporter (DMT)-like permease
MPPSNQVNEKEKLSVSDHDEQHADAGRSERLAFCALLAGAVGIAFAPIFVRLSEVGPSATAFYRLFLALPILWIWMTIEGRNAEATKPPVTARGRGQLIVAGLFFAVDLALWHWSIKFTSVANATLFANSAPIFVTLGARVLFGERIRPSFIGALAIALAGATLVVGVSLRLTSEHVLGDALAVGAAIFYGSYMLCVKHLRRTCSTATIMAWSGLSASPALLLAAFASGENLLPAHATGWLTLFALALVSQVGGQSLIAYAFAHLPASFSSLSLLLQPAVAALLAWIILGEGLSLLQALGGVVILCGITAASRANK